MLSVGRWTLKVSARCKRPSHPSTERGSGCRSALTFPSALLHTLPDLCSRPPARPSGCLREAVCQRFWRSLRVLKQLARSTRFPPLGCSFTAAGRDKKRAKLPHKSSAARTSELPRAQVVGRSHRMPGRAHKSSDARTERRDARTDSQDCCTDARMSAQVAWTRAQLAGPDPGGIFHTGPIVFPPSPRTFLPV